MLSIPSLHPGNGDSHQSQARGGVSTVGTRRGQFPRSTNDSGLSAARETTDSLPQSQTLLAAREVCALLHGTAQKALLAVQEDPKKDA